MRRSLPASASSAPLATVLAVLAVLANLAPVATTAQAAVAVSALIGDHMVVQQGRPVRLSGTDRPGQAIRATLAGGPAATTAVTTTDARGRWRLTLPVRGAGGPLVLTIEGSSTLTFSDVRAGEVWVASGQSNMELPLRRSLGGADAVGDGCPGLRFFVVPQRTAATPAVDAVGHGPTFLSALRDGAAMRVRFAAVAGGLDTADGAPPRGFVIAGADRVFHPAVARIDADAVIVSSPDVSAPVAVRYGWADDPPNSLRNQADLPAAPFRTDDWPLDLPGPTDATPR